MTNTVELTAAEQMLVRLADERLNQALDRAHEEFQAATATIFAPRQYPDGTHVRFKALSDGRFVMEVTVPDILAGG